MSLTSESNKEPKFITARQAFSLATHIPERFARAVSLMTADSFQRIREREGARFLDSWLLRILRLQLRPGPLRVYWRADGEEFFEKLRKRLVEAFKVDITDVHISAESDVAVVTEPYTSPFDYYGASGTFWVEVSKSAYREAGYRELPLSTAVNEAYVYRIKMEYREATQHAVDLFYALLELKKA